MLLAVPVLAGLLGCELPDTRALMHPVEPCVVQLPAPDLPEITAQNVARLGVVGTLCVGDEPGLINALLPIGSDTVASAGRRRPVEIWSIGTGAVQALPDTDDVNGLARSPVADRLYLVADDGRVGVSDLGSRETTWAKAHFGPAWGVAADPEGEGFVTAGRDGVVRRWSGSPPASVAEVRLWASSWCVAMRPDGAEVAACVWSGVRLLDAKTLADRGRIDGDYKSVWSAAWSADGGRLAVGVDRAILSYDEKGEQRLLERASTTVRQVAWSPDGDLIVAGTWRSELLVLDGETGASLHVGDGEQQRVQTVTVSPDGTWIATAGDGGLIRIWGVR